MKATRGTNTMTILAWNTDNVEVENMESFDDLFLLHLHIHEYKIFAYKRMGL